MTSVLTANNIKKKFTYPSRLEILKGISLTLQRNESLCIMGRSGEGKTTLLHILGTLEAPTEGSLEIAGKVIGSNPLDIRNKHIGFIFQGFHLMEDDTVIENVLMPARIGRQPVGKTSASFKRAASLIERVGLMSQIHHPARQLSGGEKQRVAIARALLMDPDLILADEPTGNLDRQTAEAIQALLFSFVKEDKGLILVTHDRELASQCDQTLTLSQGFLI